MRFKIFLRYFLRLILIIILVVCVISGFFAYNNTKRLFNHEYSYPRFNSDAVYSYELKGKIVYLTKEDYDKVDLTDKISIYSMLLFFGFGIASELILRKIKD